MTSMLFSGTKHASLYSKFRPSPPVELINSIINYLRAKFLCKQIPTSYKQAIDIGCGSGQSTIILAPYFQKVTGFDISEAQIECAKQERSAANIEYKVSDCTTFPYADSAVQLVTSSQAVHWFDTCKLFNEVKRILQPNGVIAVYGYWIPLPKTDNEEKNKKFANLICDKLYEEQLGKYWDDERYIVENHYKDINFPFKDVQRLHFVKKTGCTLADYIGYLSTWSAYQKVYTKDNNAGEKILKDTEKECLHILEENKTSEEITLALHTDFFMLIGCN